MPPASTTHMVPVRWTRGIIALASASGADEDALWSAAQLSGQSPGRQIPEDAHLRVWEAIMRALRDPGFPIRVARDRSIDDYALLGLACKTARTTRDALGHLIRYLGLWTSQYRCELEDTGEPARLMVHGPTGGLGRRCTNESSVAQIVKATRDICQQPVRPTRVFFRHPAPDDTEEHQRFFGCDVEFEAPFDGLELSATTLDSELALADDGLSSYLVAQLTELAARRSTANPLLDNVRDAITELLPAGAPALSAVATKLAIAPRTLQRRLSEAGSTFAELTENTRRELAMELLRDAERTIEEISFVLGFSERSAFQRAFKRWTGSTPASFRAD